MAAQAQLFQKGELSQNFGKKAESFDKAVERVHEKMKELLKTLHEQNIKGVENGYLKLNSANEIKQRLEEKKKKDQDGLRRIMSNALNDLLDIIDEHIERVNNAIKTVDKLEALYRKGRLDYNNPEHIILLQQAGMSQQYIETYRLEAFKYRKDELRNEKEYWEIKKQDIQNIDLNAPGAAEKIQAIEQSLEVEYDNDTAIIKANSNTQQRQIGKALGLDKEDIDEIQDITEQDFEDLNMSFGDDPISFAETVSPDTNIKAQSSKDAFAKAANPDPENSEPNPDGLGQIKISFDKNM